jgi:hypothetical protein
MEENVTWVYQIQALVVASPLLKQHTASSKAQENSQNL